MTSRAVDRDDDGVKDAFYTFSAGSLVEERHDSNNDGKPDLIVVYVNRKRTHSEEDRDHDGRMDTWTTFQVVGNDEIVVRVERDTKGRGKADLFETFTPKAGKPELAKREEDMNGDGKIDVVSIFQGGKLVSREISDPTLMPL
jgi:hypothetical protein